MHTIMNPVLTPELALMMKRGEQPDVFHVEEHQSYPHDEALYFDDGIDVLNADEYELGTPEAEMILRNAGYKSAADVEEPRIHMVYVTVYHVFTRREVKLRVMRDEILGDRVM